MTTRAELFHDGHALLGEGPVWDAREGLLFWVDIDAGIIWRVKPGGRPEHMDVGQKVGAVALRRTGGLALALKAGFALLDRWGGSFELVASPEKDKPKNRMNDGKCDGAGRFWAGTMHDPETRASGCLYRLDPDLSCHRMVSGVTVSNGLAWSPDSRVMYYADSPAKRVWAWDFDPASGEVANRRVFIDTTPTGGAPDGATVDSEGGYWLTLPSSGRVIRYDPAGKPMQTIELPVEHPTCAMFGGPRLDVLYVTTATFFRSPQELAHQPLCGGLFAIDAGVRGLPEARFRG